MTQPTEKILKKLTSGKTLYSTDTCMIPAVYGTFIHSKQNPDVFKVVDPFIMLTIRRAIGDYGDGRLKQYYKTDPETKRPVVDEKHIKLDSEEVHKIINILKVVLNYGSNFENVMNELGSKAGLHQFKVITNPQTKEILKLNYSFFRPNKENTDKSPVYSFVVSILPPTDKFPSCGVSIGFMPNDPKIPTNYLFTTRNVSRISLLISTLENLDNIVTNTMGNTPTKKYYEEWFNNIYQKTDKKVSMKEVTTLQGEKEEVPTLETPEEEIEIETSKKMPEPEEEIEIETPVRQNYKESTQKTMTPSSGKTFTPKKPTPFNRF